MSQTEFHKGKLKPIDLKGKTIEQWAEQYCTSKKKKLSCYDSWLECLQDEFYKEFIVVGEVLFSVIKEIDDSGGSHDFCQITKNEDGTYDYLAQFYNGSSSFTEVIEEELKTIL